MFFLLDYISIGKQPYANTNYGYMLSFNVFVRRKKDEFFERG